MKKYIFLISYIIIFIITGCALNNNPTSKVEELLGKYQGLDKEINYDYTDLTNDNSLNQDLIKKYNKVIKKQYRNMSYDIKEETIDGEIAKITVEIEVLDYKKTIEQNNTLNHEELIKALNNTKDKITYTVDFNVTKNKKGNWKINPLTEEQKLKLLGIY